jgi:pantetheine-phosphate adenylyltransferase
MTHAVIAGSFDPPTHGHEDLTARARGIADKVTIVIVTNTSKQPLFSVEERQQMLKKVYNTCINWDVRVLPASQYLAHFAQSLRATMLIRGFRDVIDLNYEAVVEAANLGLSPDLPTVYLRSSPAHAHVSSSLIRGLLGHDGWEFAIRPYVIESIAPAVYDKLGGPLAWTWVQTWQQLGLKPAPTAWNRLCGAYREKRRGHHGESHIAHVIREFERLHLSGRFAPQESWELPIGIMALMYHDVIYTGMVGNHDEEASADRLSFDAEKASYSRDTLMRNRLMTLGASCISGTKHVRPPETHLEAAVRDADQMILAAEPYDYDRYALGVRKDYAQFGDELFYPGRQAFLEGYLQRRIFCLDGLEEEERRAKDNLRRELAAINARLSTG